VVDPQGDGTVELVGAETSDAHLLLSVPSGTKHDAWSTNTTLRVMQPAADEDFEIEAKFESGRTGDQWTAQYSYDGSNWVTAKTFSHRLAVSSVGVFASNNNPNPAYTAVVDYFFNTGSPVIPEDTTTLFWGIQNVQAAAEETVATITWTTDEPSSCDGACGLRRSGSVGQ
jgi:hypothetical protein